MQRLSRCLFKEPLCRHPVHLNKHQSRPSPSQFYLLPFHRTPIGSSKQPPNLFLGPSCSNIAPPNPDPADPSVENSSGLFDQRRK
ncbi:hypothetical protein PCASD_05735 [Puccinia coronata f. sp. avenae]|nr:hypothetical protein PCASD_05735 [Puccinia coronata f. sp. avenae]